MFTKHFSQVIPFKISTYIRLQSSVSVNYLDDDTSICFNVYAKSALSFGSIPLNHGHFFIFSAILSLSLPLFHFLSLAQVRFQIQSGNEKKTSKAYENVTHIQT